MFAANVPRWAILALSAASLMAQSAPDPTAETAVQAERAHLVQLLRQLELPYTDWALLRDVTEKVAASAAMAQPVVAVEIEMARTNPDPRYRVRLLGVQVGLDPGAAVDQLAGIVRGEDEALAALAARVLGRVGAPAGRIDELVRERVVQDARVAVRGALLLAAGEAGVGATAPLLRTLLEKGAVTGNEVLWTWTALAQCATAELAAPARLWVAEHSQFLGAAVLMARRFGDAESERGLVRLLETAPPEPVATWVAQSLGAIGSDVARKALRTAIDADEKARKTGVLVVAAAVDPRQLALLRLGDKAARDWVVGRVARADTLLDSGIARVPELFGRWRLDGAAQQLDDWLDKPALPLIVRASAARGLCWLRERRGLEAAAALLGEKGLDALSPPVAEGLQLLQRTLHEFVDDLSRPDYRGFVLGDAKKAAAVGRDWRAWLQQHEDALRTLRWRSPGEDTEDLRFWY